MPHILFDFAFDSIPFRFLDDLLPLLVDHHYPLFDVKRRFRPLGNYRIIKLGL